MSGKDVVPRRLISSSKSVGKTDFPLIFDCKMPQICSICKKKVYYTAESGGKSTHSAVQSGIFGDIPVVLTFCSRLATL